MGFYNTCAVWGTWNVYWVNPKLYWWVYKTLRLSPLVVEHSVVVMSARLNSMGNQFLILVSWNLFSELVGERGGINIWPSWGLQHWQSIKIGYLFAFQYCNADIMNFVWKTDEGETESIVFLIFVLLQCLNRQSMRGGGVKQKVLFRACWNRIFFQPGF